MKIGGRKLGTIIAATVKKEHYIAAVNMLTIHKNPLDAYCRYLFGVGKYPANYAVRTPLGTLSIQAYSHHDLLTINEIFCRKDYHADDRDNIIVDFGSNIGVSAAYFLTRSPEAFVYMYEPLPINIEKAKKNLSNFDGRYELNQLAVGPEAGDLQFGWEETGRYGGLGRQTGNFITVSCRDSNEVLAETIRKHGRIDILKVDVETLERQIVTRIPTDILRGIRKIYAECYFRDNPLSATHSYNQYGSIARFVRNS